MSALEERLASLENGIGAICTSSGQAALHLALATLLNKGDHVICAVSGKKILIENLTYWNVDEQEAYFSYVEASTKREKI